MQLPKISHIRGIILIIGCIAYLLFTIEGQFYVQQTLKMFIPILAETASLHPMTSSDAIFKDKSTPCTPIETAYYAEQVKGAFYRTAKTFETRCTSTEFREALPEDVKTLMLDNPLYFKTHLPELLPKFPPQFLLQVVFPISEQTLPNRSFRLNAQDLDLYLGQLATQVGWRFLVDGLKQKAGETPLIYDNREPGCLIAMAKGFHYLMSTIQKDLTFKHLIQTHALCAHNIQGEMNDSQQKYIHLPFRENDEIVEVDMLDFPNTPFSLEGLKELALSPNAEKDYTLRYKTLRFPLYGEALKHRVETVITDYHRQIKTAKTPSQKLHHIVTLVATLERLHPFFDANCRTICVLTLNRELLKHGFRATLLTDPNRFHGYSTTQLIHEVVDGFENYDYVQKHGRFPGEKTNPRPEAANTALANIIAQTLRNS